MQADDGRSDDFRTVPQLWLDCCRRRSGEVAYRHKRRGIWSGITWSDSYVGTCRAATLLSRGGLNPGDVVAILSENRPEWLWFDMAAQCLGAITHGLYPTESAGRIVDALNLSGAKVVLVEDSRQLTKIFAARERCPGLKLIVVLDKHGLGGLYDEQVVFFADRAAVTDATTDEEVGFLASIRAGTADRIACLSPSAASTGVARLTAFSQASLRHVLDGISDWLMVRGGDTSLSVMSLANSAERTLTALAPLVTKLVVHFPESAATVINDLQEVAPQFVLAPPRFWEQLHSQVELIMGHARPVAQRIYRFAVGRRSSARQKHLLLTRIRRRLGLHRVRMAIAGGAATAPGLVRWYAALGVPVWDGYVLAEVLGFAAMTPPESTMDDRPVHWLPSIQVRIAPHGEIELAGHATHQGYWNHGPVARGPDGWIRTGDVSARADAGAVRLGGRQADRITNSAGVSVAPCDFERAMKASPYVLDALLIGHGRMFCTAIVAVDENSVGGYARDHEIPYTDHLSLVSHPQIIALIDREVEVANRALPEHARARAFRLIPVALTAECDELSPALRLRRPVIEAAYRSLIEEMYRVALKTAA